MRRNANFTKKRLHIVDKKGNIGRSVEDSSNNENGKTQITLLQLRRFMGMVSQLGKLTSRIAEVAQRYESGGNTKTEHSTK